MPIFEKEKCERVSAKKTIFKKTWGVKMKVMEKITSNESEREGVKFRGDKAASSHFNLVLLKKPSLISHQILSHHSSW